MARKFAELSARAACRFPVHLCLITVIPLMACSQHDPLVSSDPAVCVAAFAAMLKQASGTPLEHHPGNFDLRMRITLELDKLRRTIGLEKGQKRGASFYHKLISNPGKSANLAEECINAEAKDGEFDRRRDELRKIVNDSQHTH
ncbi:hypothetical protein [Sphingomonas lycopersici]|uniref:Uncharacterized protein n=1 Tax=Sphingomonas lycopersici TaxID=2951807 RepID=A0AA41Z598_9SPHN|nr:hypothetical protein [Sphingomonas lycopersici]MCW6534292.1 hypothetical protein [Sphingomonas lycopersici]